MCFGCVGVRVCFWLCGCAGVWGCLGVSGGSLGVSVEDWGCLGVSYFSYSFLHIFAHFCTSVHINGPTSYNIHIEISYILYSILNIRFWKSFCICMIFIFGLKRSQPHFSCFNAESKYFIRKNVISHIVQPSISIIEA